MSTAGLLLTGAFLLLACSRSVLPADQGYFIAPTVVGNSQAIQLETPTAPPPSPTPECENNLVFLRDVTVPDGTRFAPGAPVEKSWELRNDGTCAWIQGYSVELQAGSIGLGAVPRHPLPTAQPGESVVLTIQFTAPSEPGNYRSLWKAHDFAGNPFGVGFYVDITVSE
ncbi:MAG: hypothetical protein KJZ53_03835 [Anaerolineales bacterium]|nr:hypothetical protein [Anaerolineales bacterium]MCL4257644.1 hypothetical protein [Anaerolineales bacterium]